MPCRSSTEGHALGAETGDAGLLGVFGVFAVFAETGLAGETGDTGELGVLGVFAEAARSLVAALDASRSTTMVVSVGTGTDSMRLEALGDGLRVSADAPPAAHQ